MAARDDKMTLPPRGIDDGGCAANDKSTAMAQRTVIGH